MKKLTTEQFIEKAKFIHENNNIKFIELKYDLSEEQIENILKLILKQEEINERFNSKHVN